MRSPPYLLRYSRPNVLYRTEYDTLVGDHTVADTPALRRDYLVLGTIGRYLPRSEAGTRYF